MESPRIIVSARSLIRSDRNKILLLQRSESDLYNSSNWELPGGKVEPGTTIKETQIREVFEETGISIEPDNRNAYVESSVIKTGRYIGSTFISIAGLARVVDGEVKLSDEHQDYRWLHRQDLSGYDLTDVSRKALLHFRLFRDDHS
jgi:8-oxo-dGTP diphosphatase